MAWDDRKRWACAGDLNRCICRARRRVGRCEFSARLLAGMLLSGATGSVERDNPPAVSWDNRDRGAGSTWSGQAGVSDELRARVVIWPPLRLARVRRERGSVSVVLPAGSRDLSKRKGGAMRVIGLD